MAQADIDRLTDRLTGIWFATWLRLVNDGKGYDPAFVYAKRAIQETEREIKAFVQATQPKPAVNGRLPTEKR